MTRAFFDIVFTDRVRAAQKQNGSEHAYAKFLTPGPLPEDELGDAEIEFISARDGFYQASVSETGWPYVQYRGGPPGFLRVLDQKTLAYADFRGNRQYLSVGNLSGDNRIALFLMDYANRRRLKVLGRVRIVDLADEPEFVNKLMTPGYRSTPERAMVISVAAYDWNCPQHISQRFTVEELANALAPMREELAALRHENSELKKKLAETDSEQGER